MAQLSFECAAYWEYFRTMSQWIAKVSCKIYMVAFPFLFPKNDANSCCVSNHSLFTFHFHRMYHCVALWVHVTFGHPDCSVSDVLAFFYETLYWSAYHDPQEKRPLAILANYGVFHSKDEPHTGTQLFLHSFFSKWRGCSPGSTSPIHTGFGWFKRPKMPVFNFSFFVSSYNIAASNTKLRQLGSTLSIYRAHYQPSMIVQRSDSKMQAFDDAMQEMNCRITSWYHDMNLDSPKLTVFPENPRNPSLQDSSVMRFSFLIL